MPALTNKKREWDERRKLARALFNLNKIIPARELARRFKIKKWQVYAYKERKKKKLLDRRKSRQIILFYNKLKKSARGEKLLYHFRVSRGRIKPSVSVTARMIDKLIKKLGREELGKRMGVRPSTMHRWERREFVQLKIDTRKKLFQIYRKVLRKKLVGLFSLVIQLQKKRRIRAGGYSYIDYIRYFYGNEEEFRAHVESVQWGTITIVDDLINQKKKFKEKEVGDFMKEHLKQVSYVYKERSLRACQEFIKDNFEQRPFGRLTNILSRYAKG